MNKWHNKGILPKVLLASRFVCKRCLSEGASRHHTGCMIKASYIHTSRLDAACMMHLAQDCMCDACRAHVMHVKQGCMCDAFKAGLHV
mmetsp:Transcript_102945/g.165818  ORF Transcript_102945/g.165818 Transcript_102945/m.165818 type:complete len:88 (+) Transcript_102945:182-445(+)